MAEIGQYGWVSWWTDGWVNGRKDRRKEGIDGELMSWRGKGNESRKHEEKRKGDVQLLKGQIEGINWKKKKRVESDLTSGLN